MPEDKFLEKLDSVRKAALENKGKVNHNPYIWINKNVLPLEIAYGKNKNDKDTQAAITALPLNPDTRIDKTIVEKKTVAATQQRVIPPTPAEQPPATPPNKDKEG